MSAEIIRMHLSERIPTGGTDSDTAFTDAEIEALLEHNNSSVWAAVADGWAIKASEVAHLIDISEEGSERRLSQRYKNALSQAQFYARRAQVDLESLLSSRRSSVVAASVPWGIPASKQLPSSPEETVAGGPFGTEYSYTRTYPLHRSITIKR